MWAPIFSQNKKNILDVLKEYISNLEQFKQLMENEDWEQLRLEMKKINAIQTILEGIPVRNRTNNN